MKVFLLQMIVFKNYKQEKIIIFFNLKGKDKILWL